VDTEIASQRRCRNYRRRILEISQQVSALHIASAYSCTEIVDLIYNELMVERDTDENSDVFVMSKGHGCMIQYVILEGRGVLTRKDLDNYCQPSGRLGAHPDYGNPGIRASTGSLGHGLGMVVGQAYAERLRKSSVAFYVVISDGELQEGSTWEAISMASTLNLDNITVFVDNNDFTSLERMSVGQPAFYPVLEKVAAFNWSVVEIDGHNTSALRTATATLATDRPRMVIARTTKGKGVSFMEGVPIWHYRSPNAEEYSKALGELGGQ
jgi:transketolase